MTSPWTARNEALTGVDGLRYSIFHQSNPMSVAEVIRSWEVDDAFRAFFNSQLASAPFIAFRWETPAVNSDSIKKPFEFVLLNSPSLDRPPEPAAFAEHFKNQSDAVISFANLGGDAVMVVPRPIAEPYAYGHLAAFIRLAPHSQRQALWQMVGKLMTSRVGSIPVWLSTAGAGVSWLHVRLDNRPKYYGYGPYRYNQS